MKALLLKDHKLKVFGDDYDTPDGTCIRDYIHVNDLADAHVNALDYRGGGGSTVSLNVGTGIDSSVYDGLNAAGNAASEPIPYDVAPSRAGDPVSTCADPTFAETTLDWKARNGLKEIVDSACAWQKSQADKGR
jgi:UDP-glucose 4-epimerase